MNCFHFSFLYVSLIADISNTGRLEHRISYLHCDVNINTSICVDVICVDIKYFAQIAKTAGASGRPVPTSFRRSFDLADAVAAGAPAAAGALPSPDAAAEAPAAAAQGLPEPAAAAVPAPVKGKGKGKA